MLIHSRRPRFGRLLDVVAVTLLFAVFAGLAVYHYRRLDLTNEDLELVNELAKQKFAEPTVNPDRRPLIEQKRGGLRELDWPQWRGPNRNGVSPEKISTDWPADGP